MGVRFGITVSLDGFLAGPDPSLEEPLGRGGMQLHEWAFELAAWREPHGLEGGEVNASTPVVEETTANVGAYLMGRNMFGGGTGPWPEPAWNGWWGDDPPFHTPVFVLTHHPREPLSLDDTTFVFVTDGFEAALASAREAAGEKDIVVAGGASVVQQAFAAGAVDEFTVSVAPILLGGGTRLLDGVTAEVELVDAIEAPKVAHLRYRVVR
jgi:dihydrofolate reductase